MIPFSRPNFDKHEGDAVKRVLQSGYLTRGKETEAFEKEFENHIQAPYVIAVDNCTNALFLSLQYLWEKKGREHIGCPAMTFASVANVIMQAHHELYFTDKYHAGSAYCLEGTNIWDCAHEILPYIKGQIMCYSFYPNKVLSSAEGGAIATDDEEFYEWLKLASNNGRRVYTSYKYDIDFAGWKMNMTDIQAAIAREQLKKLDGFLERRAEIASVYRRELEQENEGNYLFVIRVKDRQKFMEKMMEEGIETSYHYKPLYDQPAYMKLRFGRGLNHTEYLKNNIVTLPLYPSLTDGEVSHIIKSTKLYKNA